ncbi:uncharacterized protein LOC125215979 [Salvia hispanica]|uniref:uncharacterized protein LOC125215979 n=1 Tax=Salvia hispanica TaxID=49212 RepID=UPI002008FB84|nr:uncharacterized protein LOC125215979 [Salvia hispanica]
MSFDDEFQQLVDREFDELAQEVQREAEEEDVAAFVRPFYHRRTIRRDHVGADQRLIEDYFDGNPRYPAEIFHRRFRMSQQLFICIATTLAQRYKCFALRSDASGRPGLSTYQKYTTTIRQLAYAGPADMFDEYPQLGSNNDINVLHSSHLFNDECRGEGPTVRFMANGTQYNRAYYSADGIYPRWPVFVKTIRQPVGPKQSYFVAKQEGARKDVERAFGVLQARWAILRCPVRQWHENDVASIMYACIILHNMIIDDEGYSAENWASEDGASTSHGIAIAPLQMGVPRSNAYLIQRFADMRRETSHTTLQADLVEEVWNRRGGGGRA